MSLAGDSWIIYWPTKLYLTVYSKDVHPYMLRRTYATELYRQSQDIRLM